VALRLTAQADALGGAALDGLAARFLPMAGYDERRMARTREDLVFIVQFLAATLLAADQVIFGDFLNWLQNLLVQRGGTKGLSRMLSAMASTPARRSPRGTPPTFR